MARISTTISPAHKRRHYMSLGHLVSMFSHAEAMLKVVLAHTAGLDENAAKALISGTRTDQASSYLRRCYEARGDGIPTELVVKI
jgi:hypothetical protein